MSLLTELSDTLPPHTPIDGIPYQFPTVAPFNVPVWALTPTPDGTGSTIHPDVVLFDEPWHGFQFWMAVTPYYASNDRVENPTVLCSRDGYTWRNPEGLTNPVIDWPGRATDNVLWYNSDTDMVYDPDTDELVMIWREVRPDHSEWIYQSTSPDGVTWSPRVLLLQVGQALAVSPSIIRLAEDDWRLWGININGIDSMWHATSREGPYTNETPVHFTKNGVEFRVHHGDVTYHRGRWVAILRNTDLSMTEYAAVSLDGYDWWVHPVPIITPRASSFWDGTGGYRSTVQIDPAGQFAHIWYSILGALPLSCRTAYTRVPLSVYYPDPTSVGL